MFRLFLSHLQALEDTDRKQGRLVHCGIPNPYIYLVYSVKVCMTLIVMRTFTLQALSDTDPKQCHLVHRGIPNAYMYLGSKHCGNMHDNYCHAYFHTVYM